MSDAAPPTAQARLTLNSQLAELVRAQRWMDELAALHQIPADTLNKMQLCLEEALMNVIRYGYRDEPGHTIHVSFAVAAEGSLSLTIEDSAPPFNPVEAPHPVTPSRLEDLVPGGQGIHLMRRFAASLAWQPLAHGNRLTLTFPYSAPGPEPPRTGPGQCGGGPEPR